MKETIHKFSSTLSTIKSNYRLFVLFTQNIMKSEERMPIKSSYNTQNVQHSTSITMQSVFFRFTFLKEKIIINLVITIFLTSMLVSSAKSSRKQSHNWIGGNFTEVNSTIYDGILWCSTWKCKMSQRNSIKYLPFCGFLSSRLNCVTHEDFAGLIYEWITRIVS